jgi:Fur family ferric uptake transcriptional regulator
MSSVIDRARKGGPVGTNTEGTRDHFRKLLDAFMEKKGLRSTKQREHIVETFFAHPDHVSIEELLALVRERDPSIGYATVYRTLKLLTESGVAFERKFGDGLTRYELADDESHHDHLICVECKRIVEFEEPRVEAMQDEIAEKHGFVLRSHKHELYGVCPDCQRKAKLATSRGVSGRGN